MRTLGMIGGTSWHSTMVYYKLINEGVGEQIGTQGNKPTMSGDFIPSRLKFKFDINTVVPDQQFWDKSHYYVSKELTQGIFSEEARIFYLQQMRLLKEKGAEGIILGCTELPLLIKDHEIDIPLLSTTQLHAQAAVDFILDTESLNP